MRCSIPSAGPSRAGSTLVSLLALALGACQPPPPAPEGLDEAARFMLREFYEDDVTIGAGLTGLMNWYDTEGYELVNQSASAEEGSEAFELAQVEAEDIEFLPIPEDGRDLANANGIVSISEMACSWTQAEAFLIRPDQHVVFDDFDSYSRTYDTSRSDFEAASSEESFPTILQPITGVFEPPYELGDLTRSMLLTHSQVTSSEFGVTLDYELVLHFRHGIYQVQDEDMPVSMILSYLPEPASGAGGENTLEQSYSVEINFGVGDQTLRIFGVWTYVESSLLGPDSNLWDIGAVNKSRNAAVRLSDICAGEIEVPEES